MQVEFTFPELYTRSALEKSLNIHSHAMIKATSYFILKNAEIYTELACLFVTLMCLLKYFMRI